MVTDRARACALAPDSNLRWIATEPLDVPSLGVRYGLVKSMEPNLVMICTTDWLAIFCAARQSTPPLAVPLMDLAL